VKTNVYDETLIPGEIDIDSGKEVIMYTTNKEPQGNSTLLDPVEKPVELAEDVETENEAEREGSELPQVSAQKRRGIKQRLYRIRTKKERLISF